MNIKYFSIGIILLVITSIIIINKNNKDSTKISENGKNFYNRKIYLGAWVQGFWDNDTKTVNTEVLSKFEQDIDKKVAIANMFSEWAYLSNKELLGKLNAMSIRGWTPMISSNPYFFEDCQKEYPSLYKTISSGACDKFLKRAAANLRGFKKPILFRFAWEMNLPQMYWSVPYVKSTPDEFIASWRRMHDIFRKERADNVVWVLSFNTTNSVTIPYAMLYPGDDYVDWVAIDGYNWGDSHEWSGWQTFEGVFRNSYDELTAITDKPVMISEVNSAETGGNKTEWLKQMLTEELPYAFPRVVAVVFFNENKEAGEKIDWRIEKRKEYVSVVQEALGHEMYVSEFP